MSSQSLSSHNFFLPQMGSMQCACFHQLWIWLHAWCTIHPRKEPGHTPTDSKYFSVELRKSPTDYPSPDHNWVPSGSTQFDFLWCMHTLSGMILWYMHIWFNIKHMILLFWFKFRKRRRFQGKMYQAGYCSTCTCMRETTQMRLWQIIECVAPNPSPARPAIQTWFNAVS